ncbi:tetratricopeptide repeat protein [Falsiroseomonas sp. HW251]|uniref:tetratricopeptide repeat protein n=1 Tax=Falsiroseomonas sp. HW251 TaxID=3390998 RepID=UPI003D31DD1B
MSATANDLDDDALERLEADRRAILAADPARAAAWLDLASLRVARNRPAEAEDAARRGLALDPSAIRGWIALGAALRAQDRTEEAIAAGRHAATLVPASGDPHHAIGVSLARAGRHEEAAQAYREALARDPGHALAAFNLALTLLTLGDYAEGFRRYECRFRSPAPPLPPISLPEWDGAALPPGTQLLARAEQGFGDTIQFLRFAEGAAARGARVLLLCQPPLRRLAASAPAVAEVLKGGERIAAGTPTIPLMSLPRVLGTTLATLPAPPAYLSPLPEARLAWSRRLGARPGLRVGLCWRGNPASGGPGTRRWTPCARSRSPCSRRWPRCRASPGRRWPRIPASRSRRLSPPSTPWRRSATSRTPRRWSPGSIW